MEAPTKEVSTEFRQAEFNTIAEGVTINTAAWWPLVQHVLVPEALALIARLHRAMESRRQRLLAARRTRQAAYDQGALPDYLDKRDYPEAHGDWKVAPLPPDLLKRRVEITGPISDPKMVINMLSRTDDGYRADAAMLDFEDAMKPSWSNIMQGVKNLIEAVDGTLTYVKPATGRTPEKRYELDPNDMPLLMVRVRGLHLDEANLLIDGTPVSGGLMDFALSTFHTARKLMEQGKTPKYYVPKVEHYLEARWWNDLFTLVEKSLGVPVGSFKATFLIETLPAAFQMEEILYELRNHAAGLNGGRWDKIFSDIKVLRAHPDRVLADRNTIGVSNRIWMSNYVKLLIKICHRHGAFGMGGMAPQTPGRTAEMRKEQVRKVVDDKIWEAGIGHDGCWVSHPYFIGPAMKPFTRDNQLDVIPNINGLPDLIPQATGPRTMDGVRVNVRVAMGYVKGWNQDIGCVAWDDRMEDLATLEISRAQLWQWLHHRVALDDGTPVTPELVHRVFSEELTRIIQEIRGAMLDQPEYAIEKEIERYRQARTDAEAIFVAADFRSFLTCSSDPAHLTKEERRAKLRQNTCR